MGTSSIIKFIDTFQGKEQAIAEVYGQYDGYLAEVGFNLAEMLRDITMINGFNENDKMGTHANGMGCLAAQYVVKAKERIGGVYLLRDAGIQNYNYEVREVGKGLEITVFSYGEQLFKGNADALYEICHNERFGLHQED